jgi:hypothetical protein
MEDYVFHYQKRENHRLKHDVQITFADVEGGNVGSVISKIADFLRAIGHDFDYIQVVKKVKNDAEK